jgi:hypothetical protein
MTLLLSALVGLLAGAHAATWGMYKDAIHEGFTYRKYSRSIVLATAVGLLIDGLGVLEPHRAADAVVLFGVIYAVERALAEVYKTFIREEDQSKYFIPMQFHVFGRMVGRPVRWLAGALYVSGMVLGMTGVRALGAGPSGAGGWRLLLAGGVGGWVSAVGGAWKDAPKEGFQVLKFFRSPALATAYALGLSTFSDDLLLIALAATGYTVATTETYKTFFFLDKPRGKFAGKPVRYPETLERRKRFVALYVAIWVAIVAGVAAAAGAP